MVNTKDEDDFILSEARSILVSRMRQPGGIIHGLEDMHQYLTTEYALLQKEQFGCMFLDRNYSLINHLTMFRGTISSCATYPREIAREALLQNAVFVILIHNHPAHNREPSADDIAMTHHIQQVLAIVDIVLFDHVIVAGIHLCSMRAMGLLE
jgi:DNA repair protein RadC